MLKLVKQASCPESILDTLLTLKVIFSIFHRESTLRDHVRSSIK